MLGKSAQTDFRAGMVPGVARDLIPQDGLYDVVNGLLDDDGAVYRRGGCEYQSNAAFGTGLRWIWDGFLGPGQRTVIARSTSFGVLDADDATVVDLGGSGLAAPTVGVEIGGLLFIGGGTIYGGSRKAADYSTGTITVTQGSAVVTGAGTAFTANVDGGMLLRVAGAGRYYAVASVDSNTQITLADAYLGTGAAGQAYALTRLGTAGLGTALPSQIYAVAGKRLLECNGATVGFSGYGNPHVFALTDNHRLPAGSRILGAAGLQSEALIFATSGLWAISNMTFDLVDPAGNPQQRLSHLAPNFVLWGNEGIAEHSGQLVVPATDGVWIVGPSGPAEQITFSITPLYVSYIRAGYSPGRATVYKSHYFLPILDGSSAVVDLLVCRLDRPVWMGRHRPSVFPWTHWSGQGGNVAACAVRSNAAPRSPQLLAAGRGTSSRVLKLGGCFEPSAARKNDADGTTHVFDVTTRDYTTGPLNANFVKKIRLRYELVGTDAPTIQAYYSVGKLTGSGSFWGAATWGTGTWTDSSLGTFQLMAGSAPVDDGRNPFPWKPGRKNRFIRYRFRCTQPAASLTLRWLEQFVRSSGRM